MICNIIFLLGDRKNMSSLQVDIEWFKVSFHSHISNRKFLLIFIFGGYSDVQCQAKTKQMIKTDV